MDLNLKCFVHINYNELILMEYDFSVNNRRTGICGNFFLRKITKINYICK